MRALVVVVVALLATPSEAQVGEVVPEVAPNVRLSGRVLDAFTSLPLADVTLAAAERTAVTDAEGRFVLLVPEGLWELRAEREGFTPFSLEVDARSGPSDGVEIYLLDKGRFSETVEVKASREAAPGAPTLLPVAPEQVLAAPGSADNVFRTLQTLPGVAAVEEFGSRLSVRGGAPDQNLTVMDGVEIHNPYRLLGLVSAFNPETIESFELSAGTFSARHGDRLSSLLVVTTRAGRADRGLTGASSLSITDGNVVLEGDLPGEGTGSWLLTGRRTYYDLVAERFVDDDLPSFADLQLRADWELGRGRGLSLQALRSRESTDASFEDGPRERGRFVTGAENDLLSISFRSPLGSRGFSRTIGSLYRNAERLDVDALFQNGSRRSNAPEEEAVGLANVVFARELSARDASLRQELVFQLSDRHLLDAGFEYHSLSTSVGWDITGDRNTELANGSSVRGGTGLPDQLESTLGGNRWGAWLQDRFQVSPRLTLEPGVRVDRSGVNRRTTLSPRLSLGWVLDDSTRLQAGVGLHTQSPGYEKLFQSDYFLDLSEGRARELDHERSLQAVLGLERTLGAGLSARLEGYYRRLDDLIVGRLESEPERLARIARYDFPEDLSAEVPTEPQITTDPVGSGRGTAYGFDLYLTRRATSADTRLTGWASYTWGQARREAYGRTFPFEYDRRHALSLVANMRLSSRLEIGAAARLATGFPRTPFSGVRVAATEDVMDVDGDGNRLELIPERDANGLLVYRADPAGVSPLNSARHPFYARLDLRATFEPRGPKGRWTFYLELINALGRENSGGVEPELEYDPDSDRPRLVERGEGGIPFLPSFGVRFRF